MAIDVRPVCPSDGGECIIELEQTVDMVLDIQRSKRPRGELSYFKIAESTDSFQIIPYPAQFPAKT